MRDLALKHRTFAALRQRLGVTETGGPAAVPIRKDGFPGHLLEAGLHEIVAERPGDHSCALAFTLAAVRGKPLLMATLAHDARERGGLYGAGLAQLGLDPRHSILVAARDEKHLLWAAEEGAACPAPGGVIVSLSARERLYGFTASRRLKVRLETSGFPVFVLRQRIGEATAATAR
jgi:protein ImuA